MDQRNVVAIPRDKRVKTAHPASTSALTDEARWQLVLAHTPTPDFLYGVISTGIFCRTSCPSRRPRRANVQFFDSAASAIAAGFRACRRCRPESNEASHQSPQASAEKQVQTACDYIRQRKGEVQLLEIAAHVGLSPRYFHGLFKQVMGTTPGAYAAAVKQECINAPEAPVATVSGPASLDFDFSSFPTTSHPTPIDNGSSAVPFVNHDETTYDWLLESFGDPGCINYDQCLNSDWFNDHNFDIPDFSGINNGSLEPEMNTHSSDFVDPSQLSSSRAPP
ncbi:metal binding domain of Ada-domain-containing protein [Nemania sp. FL0031]|nr:metal binding domain of Ada-domain-containing protein [Nemania sp. FL0031]